MYGSGVALRVHVQPVLVTVWMTPSEYRVGAIFVVSHPKRGWFGPSISCLSAIPFWSIRRSVVIDVFHLKVIHWL